ncbi:putative glycosyltransferase At5g03795 [Apium graveolens]|uniref:putative glycosyltransferase At5g03795 n=1 Tax=Apium graveolens TaxID=4045 RepID=UPI003D7B7DF9
MSSELARKCQVESRRWIWLFAVLFAMVIMVQYVELPYGNIVSYVFPDGRTRALLNGSSLPANLSGYHNNADNLTVLGNLNYTSTASDNEKTETATISVGKNLTQERNFTSGSKSALNNTSLTRKQEDNIVSIQENGVSGNSSKSPSFASPLMSPTEVNLATVVSNDPRIKSVNNDTQDRLHKTDGLGTPQSGNSATVKKEPKSSKSTILSLSDMKDLLHKNRASSYSMEPRWSSAVDSQILEAKSQIVNAPTIADDHSLYAPIYRNVSMFRRSYEIMEQTLKVYIYQEGKRPIFHNPQPVLTGIYASEGWFMKLLEGNKQYVTNNPNDAHLFYLPFSSRMLEETLYVRDSHSHANLIKYLEDYLDLIVGKYPFWNRTGGADHFLVACHDWAPAETRARLNNCTKALCNADIKEGFRLGKDVSLPETIVRSSKNLLRDIGGKIPRQRPILAFFAGQMHGYLRPMLLQQWQNKDPDIKLFTKLPKSKNNRNYIQYMKSSKYCICPRGYEVNSPRVVEAIFFECVPVIISDNFVPPFFEILNWESFAVFIQEEDLPNLKNILLSISDRRYEVMQQRVKRVQQHFLWHPKPVKYDIFHMILHSVWYNRVFQVRSS